jgi:acyl-CoA hydrolase
MIGEAPFFVEVNHRMPRTSGENQVDVSKVLGWCEADYPLVELPTRPERGTDRRIAKLVAERISDGATLQAGIRTISDEVLGLLGDHKNLGVHTELLSDGFVDLVEKSVITGTHKRSHRNKIVTTTALGSRRLYEFVDEIPGVEFWPVSYTYDPRNIAREDHMAVINATLEVDFLGQCASESLGSEYWSSSGGQPDFVRGAIFAEHGQSFCSAALHHRRRIGLPNRGTVAPRCGGHHVQERRGLRRHSIRERTRKLIDISHPRFRDDLEREAREMGYL